MVSHSKHMFRVELHFLIVPDVSLRVKFKIYNTSIAYSRKIEYGNNWHDTVAIMRTLLRHTGQLEIVPENVNFFGRNA